MLLLIKLTIWTSRSTWGWACAIWRTSPWWTWPAGRLPSCPSVPWSCRLSFWSSAWSCGVSLAFRGSCCRCRRPKACGSGLLAGVTTGQPLAGSPACSTGRWNLKASVFTMVNTLRGFSLFSVKSGGFVQTITGEELFFNSKSVKSYENCKIS